MAERKTKKKKEEAQPYEAMFLFPAGASADLENTLKTVRGIIERHGGEIIVLKKWDERKLAYELKKNKRGLYVIAYFTAPGPAVGAIERDVNLSEDILRVIVIKADHLNKEEMEAVEPQPIQKEPERREWTDRSEGFDRRDRGDRGERNDRPPRPRREEHSEEPAPTA